MNARRAEGVALCHSQSRDERVSTKSKMRSQKIDQPSFHPIRTARRVKSLLGSPNRGKAAGVDGRWSVLPCQDFLPLSRLERPARLL
jgi:hypothetical protein